MKINPVKQFVKNNISQFEAAQKLPSVNMFCLYDKNRSYRGEYIYRVLSRSERMGTEKSLSVTRITDENLYKEMQEFVYMNKDYVTLKDKNSDVLTRLLPFEITTITTIVDYINDKFQTVRRTSKLKNELQRIGKNDPDFVYSDDFILYEPLKEKPKYEQSVEVVREGSVSETKKDTLSIDNYYRNSRRGCLHQIPYRFW